MCTSWPDLTLESCYCQRFKEAEAEWDISSEEQKENKWQMSQGKDGAADWYGAQAGWETAGGKGTKSIDDVSKGEIDAKADVRMRGGWSTCCTCKLIKQCRNWWVKKESSGGARGETKELSRAETTWWKCPNHCFPPRGRSITNDRKTDVKKNPPGDPFVS